ncbi:excinuclease ABC subunit UvrA [Candidatus Magnetominusculus xianensis]|uniref:UvrABC system protein A n=1 Tax=Candidatus Magnetominusculus xianensis TaxID=1748249 RepID=A0ABR5SDF3_9BACT|nr:excinuclease ABC subunit UvrA [Candidatus Magnetominusculus xianensis]KWT82943.1 excinuclease ABC subunit A [Candidatus Magnetominusculus xianensis]MBF0403022.1 excinuclease ABC subunit UvrA [Nitrospirota bacterium]
MPALKWLEITGIKQNNLQNISVKIPHDKFVVITGVSGSGKSSLAFDTIFAEGQWRFIESLSTYAKLFLEKLDRPQLEEVRNIRPAIALQQRNPVKTSRSTVGTVTEIYDLLRVVFARTAQPFCHMCGVEIRRWDTDSIYKSLIGRHNGAKAAILFRTDEPLSSLRERGFYRIFKDGEFMETFGQSDKVPGTVEGHDVLIDRLVVRDESRLADSIELAWREGGGTIKIIIYDNTGQTELLYSDGNSCDACGALLPEPTPLLFSYNHPIGACPACKGFGNILIGDMDLIVPNPQLSLSDGAIDPWEKPAFDWWKTQMLRGAEAAGIDIYKPAAELSEYEWMLLNNGVAKSFHGLSAFFKFLSEERHKLHLRVFLNRYRKPVICSECNGTRLKKEVLAFKLKGPDMALNIAAMNAMTVKELLGFFTTPAVNAREAIEEALRHIRQKLTLLSRVGLDYLTLDRQTMTLSGGEYQRVNIANQLSCSLAGALYVLDEPTVGLHSRDNERITEIIGGLARQGNTVLVVEHDPEIIRAAEWVIELGPGGGSKGGSVVFNGAIGDFEKSETITSGYLNNSGIYQPSPKQQINHNAPAIVLTGASGHNLKDITLHIPLNALTVVSGVSGSGKSSLVVDTLYQAAAGNFNKNYGKRPLKYNGVTGLDRLKGVCLVDQSPIGRSPRSNPATYLKFFDTIRSIFASATEARLYGYGPGHFSFNVAGGRCELCKGEGYQKLEMYFFEDLYVKCPDCAGNRYSADTLRVKYKGLTISDVLNLSVDDAADIFWDDPAISKKLQLLKDVGLGYLRIGQPATTLSGGEAQRLKICAALGGTANKGFLYILDEPTIGLHMRDVQALLTVLRRLISLNNTIVVIEHNMDVIREADWVVDLGPEGGDAGGELLFEGTPEDLYECSDSHTGTCLNKYVQRQV